MCDVVEACRRIMFIFMVFTMTTGGVTVWLSRPSAVVAVAEPLEISIEGGLYFQNNTHENMWVAVGYEDDSKQWFSQGWFKLAPGETHRTVVGILTKRYYTYYARNVNEGYFISGDRQFWVSADNNKAWKNVPMGLNPNEAAKQGFQSRSFVMLDLGSPPREKVVVILH